MEEKTLVVGKREKGREEQRVVTREREEKGKRKGRGGGLEVCAQGKQYGNWYRDESAE